MPGCSSVCVCVCVPIHACVCMHVLYVTASNQLPTGVCVCAKYQLISQSNEADETVRLMASKLMQSRSGSLVPMKSTTSASVKLSLTQQFSAAGTHLSCPFIF